MLDVNDDNIDLFNKKIKMEPSLIMYYATDCFYCKQIKDTWEHIGQELENKFFVAKIERNYKHRIERNDKIEGVPTIFAIYRKKKYQYNGNRTANDLLKFANAKLNKYIKKKRRRKKSSTRTKKRKKRKKRTRGRISNRQ